MKKDDNNSRLGFTVQKVICDTYGITPIARRAASNFLTNYDEEYAAMAREIIPKLFNTIGKEPTSCHTYQQVGKYRCPYNFTLSDNSTLSIRTTKSPRGLVSPRIIGQACFKTLTERIGDIYGGPIESQDDLRHLFTEKMAETTRRYAEYMMDADRIVWMRIEDGELVFDIFDGDMEIQMDFEEKNFTLSQTVDTWNESATLKYKGEDLANIQLHKDDNRDSKYRFYIQKFMSLLKETKKNNETLGITAEVEICNLFDLDVPPSYKGRSSSAMADQIRSTIEEAFASIPAPIRNAGAEGGARGGQSKSPVDFILEGGKTLSVKTNKNNMVCPSEIGQPGDKTCYLYFHQFTEEDHMDREIFKRMVFEHVHEMIPMYLEHLFDCDYLLRIKLSRNGKVSHSIVAKEHGFDYNWEHDRFRFSNKTVEDWEESNTVYYGEISLGNFQVHNNRNCFKFRFNYNNLLKILNE